MMMIRRRMMIVVRRHNYQKTYFSVTSTKTVITSRSNPQIKTFRRLAKTRDFVRIEGSRHVKDAMKHSMKLQYLFTTPEHSIVTTTQDKHYHVTESVMKHLSTQKSPSGVLALFERPEAMNEFPTTTTTTNRVVLICDGVSDPGNLGTLIRTACAFDCDAVITTRGGEGADPWNEKCVRSTASAILSIPVLEWELQNERNSIDRWLRKNTTNVYVADTSQHNVSYDEVEFLSHNQEHDIAIVLGNEGKGVSSLFKDLYDDVSTYVRIPIVSESLNVGVAGGIILSEIRRQEKKLLEYI